jgi:hypothetical protein
MQVVSVYISDKNIYYYHSITICKHFGLAGPRGDIMHMADRTAEMMKCDDESSKLNTHPHYRSYTLDQLEVDSE